MDFQVERITSNTANWWAITHSIAILGQLGLAIAGVVTFIFSRPNRWEDHMPSDDEFWDDNTTTATIPWISGGVGAFTTVIHSVIFLILYKAYNVSQARRLERQKDVFRNAVLVASIVLLLVLVADIALAVNAGLHGLKTICTVASLGSIFTISTIFVDHVKLRKHQREARKHQYVINLARDSAESITPPPPAAAPPSYEAAIRAPK